MTQLTTYAVQGTSFTTSKLFNALAKAKTKALRNTPAVITKDGTMFATVNHKGVLKTV